MVFQIDPERCQRCEQCLVEVGCLGQVVERAGHDQAPVIHQEQCYGCGLCSMMCRHDAVVERSTRAVEEKE